MVASDRLADFHAALMAQPNAIMRDAIRLCMFTGMPRGECTSLRWQDVDFNERLIRLPAQVTKANRDCELPMNDVVLDVLVARRAIGKDRFVFPGAGKSSHISYLQDAFDSIAESTGIKISAHDLRRTFASSSARSPT